MKFLISEEEEQNIIGDLLSEAFYPTTDKVLYIKQYLDKNFAKQMIDDIDANGYPVKEPTVVMLSSDKQPIKTLTMYNFLLLLDDKFNNIIKDNNDRKAFLKQLINDWFHNKITKNGLLSVNHI